MPLEITVTKKERGIFVVSPVGSLDSETHMLFEDEIDKILGSSPRGILVNMKGVDYISSIGLGVLFKARKAIEKIQGTLIITDVQPQIRKVLTAIKFIPEHIFENMSEADQHLDKVLDGVQKEQA